MRIRPELHGSARFSIPDSAPQGKRSVEHRLKAGGDGAEYRTAAAVIMDQRDCRFYKDNHGKDLGSEPQEEFEDQPKDVRDQGDVGRKTIA
jgi:hypothetical protein